MKWCNDVVEDDGRFIECARDGVEWDRPRHWSGKAGLINQLGLFTKNVTQAELLGIAQAAALYDGDGRTDVPTSLCTLKSYLALLTSKDPKKVLMGRAVVRSQSAGCTASRILSRALSTSTSTSA